MGDSGATSDATSSKKEDSDRASAPASPRLQRPSTPGAGSAAAQGINPDSKIPRPTSLTSPVPLRRSGSLRLRGEKHARGRSGAGAGGASACTGAASPCTSILEGAEAWKRSLRARGAGAGASANTGGGGCGDGFPLPSLRHARHHRSLQSLISTPVRLSSNDSYPHTPTPSPDEFDLSRPHNLNRFLLDHSKEFSGDREDLDSLKSYGSNCSTQSACDHAHFGRNGTTFSGRRMKYIVHCSSHPEPDEYLTPTQRANQQIRRLKALLEQSRKDLEQKDENIFKLTKEVVELRLLRDESDGSGAKAGSSNSENNPKLNFSGEFLRADRVSNMGENDLGTPASLSDSGHFDDLLSTTSANLQLSPGPRKIMSSNDCERLAESYQRRIDDLARRQNEKSIEDRKSLVDMYEKKMEEMCKKLTEKEKIEKHLLIETYEKKLENILKEKKEKYVDESEKKADLFTKDTESERHLLATKYEETITDLQKKLSDFQQHCKESHLDEINSLKILLQDANNRYSDLQQELFQAREKLVELEEETELLKSFLKKQKDSQDDFEEKVISKYKKEQRDATLHQEQILRERSVLENEIRELKVSINSLEKNVDEADYWKKEASALCMTLEAVKAEVKTLNREIDKLKNCEAHNKEEIESYSLKLSEQDNIYKIRIDELKTDYESTLALIQKDCKNLQEQKANLESNCEELQRLLDSSKNFEMEITRLKNLLKEKELNQTVNAEEVYLRQQIDSLVQNLTEKDRDLIASSQKLHELEEEVESMKVVSQCKRQQEELLATKNKDLEREVAHLKDECNVRRAELIEINNHITDQKNESDKTLFSYIQRSSQLEEEALSLQKELSECKEIMDNLQTTCDGLQSELLGLRKASSEEKELYKRCRDRLEEVDVKNTSLENEIGSMKQCLSQKDHELKLQLERTCQLQETVSALQGIAAEHEETNKELITTKLQLKEKNAHLIRLQSEIEDLKGLVTHATSQLDESNRNILSLNAKINSLLVTVNQKDQELAENTLEHKEETSSLVKKLVDLERAYRELQEMKEELEKQLLASEEQVGMLKLNQPNSESIDFSNTSMNDLQRVYQDLLLERHKSATLNKEVTSLKQSACNGELTEHHEGEISLSKVERATMTNIEGEENNQTDEVAWLQAEVESLKKAITEQELRHNETNLKMYIKGQEAAKFQRKDEVLEMAAHAPDKVSVPELLSQLTETEKELEKVKVMYRRLAEGQASNSSSPEATLIPKVSILLFPY